MRTLRVFFAVAVLSLFAGACSNAVGPDCDGVQCTTHTPDNGSHTPDNGS